MVFVHAALRMRNLKSKLNEKLEAVGFKKTPMGIIFDAIGLEVELVKFNWLEPKTNEKIREKLAKLSKYKSVVMKVVE